VTLDPGSGFWWPKIGKKIKVNFCPPGYGSNPDPLHWIFLSSVGGDEILLCVKFRLNSRPEVQKWRTIPGWGGYYSNFFSDPGTVCSSFDRHNTFSWLVYLSLFFTLCFAVLVSDDMPFFWGGAIGSADNFFTYVVSCASFGVVMGTFLADRYFGSKLYWYGSEFSYVFVRLIIGFGSYPGTRTRYVLNS
jgi:hypothetical protein